MTAHDARPPQVLIAGAGIAGLASALALARAGARVILVEQAAELAEVGAGLQLSPNSTRILRDLGVLEAVAVRATSPSAIRVRSAASGATLAAVPLDGAERRYGAPYLVSRRADLQSALLGAVAAEPAISLRLGTALAGFGAMSSGARAGSAQGGSGLADGIEASLKQGLLTRTLRADALIGTDGIRSTVRARLHGGAADAPLETGRTAWRAMVEAAALAPTGGAGARPAETGLWLGRDSHLVHYPIDGGRLVNVVAVIRDGPRPVPADPARTDMAWSAPGDAAVIAARFRGWHADARRLVAAAPAWSTWPLFDRAPLAGWNSGPVALAGDAAHPILPFLAQGAAQAIEDAGALGRAFAAEADPSAALARFSAARVGRAALVQQASRRLGRIYHLGGPAGAARDAAMRLLGGRRLLERYDWLYGA